jgi:hypothetical protein
MTANPATDASVPKMLHLGADNEFHAAPGECVLFAGAGPFAVVFPGDSPFHEHVFSDTHAKSQPVSPRQGKFKYYWAKAGVVSVPASPGVLISGVVGPDLMPGSAAKPAMGGQGIIIVP